MADNKKGLWVVLAIVVIGFLLFQGGILKWPAAAPAAPSDGGVPQQGGNTIITSPTTLNFVTSDALSQGTTVAVSTRVGINGGILNSGVTTASPGNTLEVLYINGSSYHNAYDKVLTVPSAPTFPISKQLKKAATVGMVLFNTNGQVMDGTTTNQTVIAGGSYNIKVRIDGQDKASTSDMTCILEASDSTKVDKATLTGFGATYVGMAKPSSYALSGVNSQVFVYDVPAIEGAISPEGVIGVTTKTGQTIANQFVKITCRSKDYFIDSLTGKVGFAIEDSNGASQSLSTYTATAYFK